MLLEENEITWQNIIYGLIKSEEMDPWDIDVSILTQKYLETLKQMKEMNFFLSGKVLLASAVLVKIKSNKLVEEDIGNFDNYLFHQEDEMDTFDEFGDFVERPKINAPGLGIKTPQARKRRVTVQDLIGALEKALSVNKRRILRKNELRRYTGFDIPEKKVNISDLIKDIFERIKSFFSKKEEVTFSKLLPQQQEGIGKREKILTLYPLLHLDTQGKIDIQQEEHFGEITIKPR
jgi:segregation and condensation protein A